jgi:3-dehydroquinate dehydratase/shikimate dehydrogenase
VRLDGVADLDVAGALADRTKPVVVTCRPQWEGGRFAGSEDERHRILSDAMSLGAEFVDVEWAALHAIHAPGFGDIVERAPSRVVVSSHDFDGVPFDVDARARDMRSYGAAVIKIAVMARALRDTLPLLAIARDGDAVVVGMGDAGVPTRLLAARFGSRWSYAGNGAAPGQIPAERMLSQFRFRDIGPATRLFGVVSSTAMHSFSPVMHNAAFAAAALDAVYVPLQTTEFGDFDEFAAALGVEGVSVTIPFKGDALRAASDADDLTRQVGAANTLRRHQNDRGADLVGSAEASLTRLAPRSRGMMDEISSQPALTRCQRRAPQQVRDATPASALTAPEQRRSMRARPPARAKHLAEDRQAVKESWRRSQSGARRQTIQ